MPPAARITDMHTCPMVTGLVPHVGGPIVKGQPNVLTGGLPQARLGDTCVCVGPPDIIVKGSVSVMVGGMPAARIGDQTAHGGVIVLGLPTVMIGDTGGGGGGGGGAAGPAGGRAAQGGTTDIAPGWASLDYMNMPFQRETLKAAAVNGTPFCEICAKAYVDDDYVGEVPFKRPAWEAHEAAHVTQQGSGRVQPPSPGASGSES